MRYLWPPNEHIALAKTWGKANELQRNLKYGYDLRLKTMTLCGDCNTKWLGPFEEQAKPKLRAWISGLKGPVVHGERQLLAFWATKTAMTVDLAHPSGGRLIPPAHCQQLHANRDYPPAGVHAWAALRRAKVRGIEHRARPFQVANIHGDEVAPGSVTHAGYHVVFVIGHLELQVIGHVVGGSQPADIPGLYRLWPLPDDPLLAE